MRIAFPLSIARWCAALGAVPMFAGSSLGFAASTETILWKGDGWTVATTEKESRVTGCHAYADYEKGTRFVLALDKDRGWRGALGEHGKLADLRPGRTRLVVDGQVIFSGRTRPFPGGGIRLGSLGPKVIDALSDGHRLSVLTSSGKRALTLSGSEDAIKKVRECVAAVFEFEQKHFTNAVHRVKSGTSGGAVNLRSGPDIEADVVAEIPEASEPIKPLGACSPSQDRDNSRTWCRFAWRDNVGWISMRVVVSDFVGAKLTPGLPDFGKPGTSTPRSPNSKEESRTSSGTAFFISKGGHLITNSHVVDGCKNLTISQPGALSPSPAALLARDKNNDLALIQISPVKVSGLTDGAGKGFPALRRQVRLGENIAVFGYPLAGIVASSGNFVRGSVTALAGIGDDTTLMQIDAPIQPGNSGGPVLDDRGNVVAVVVGKLNDLKVAKAIGSLPQQINFAIKANTAAGFLEANGVAFAEPDDGARRLEPADLAEFARRFTVQVECRD